MTQTETDSRAAADQAARETRDAAADLGQRARTTARDAAGKVSRGAQDMAHKAQDSAADEVKDVASALRTAAEELRNGSPQQRTFSQIADGLADVSDSMRDKDMGEMMHDLNSFARRNPVVFLGGAALLGFAATRFAKASGRGSQGDNGREPAHMRRDMPAQGADHGSATGQSAPTATPSAAPSSVAFRATDTPRPVPGTASTAKGG